MSVLQPISDGITAACFEKFLASLSLAALSADTVGSLSKALECDIGANFAKNWIKSLKMRFPGYKMVSVCAHATLLDPQLKGI